MSFSENVKNELTYYQCEDEKTQKIELSALLKIGGSVLLGKDGKVGIVFNSSNNAIVRRVFSVWKEYFSLKPMILIRKGIRLNKRNVYILKIEPSLKGAEMLSDLQLFPFEKKLSLRNLNKVAYKRAFLRGIFLGGGSISKPQRDYHLELTTTNKDFADVIQKTMKYFGLPAKIIERKKDFVIYLKDGDSVTTFLQIIGADQSLLAFESVRVMKNMRNNVNRVVNFETANLQRTVEAAVRQLESIKIIQQYMPLNKLPIKLRRVAELRLENPEANLTELVELSDENITKSGLNHRFTKLENFAKELVF